jgi:DNA-directed RNA polymerase subunit RPC12/RpoP
MSISSIQINELREVARNIQGNLGRCLYRRQDEQICDILFKAANTIESLQATIEMGSGTCKNEWAQFGKFRCSKCWLQVDSISTNTTAPTPIKYCPNCGRKVERWC